MLRSVLFTVLAASLMSLSFRVTAHHALEDLYDLESSIELSGLVTRFSWANPHASLVLEVADDEGGLVLWAVEMAPPSALMRRGVSPDMIADGQAVTIEGNPGLDGVPRLNAVTLTLPTGEVLDVEGSSWVQLGSNYLFNAPPSN